MWKRMLVMLTVTGLIVAGLGFVKFRQIQAAIAQGAAFQPPPEAVTTMVAVSALPPEDAMIIAVPGPTPLMAPALTDATEALEDFQATGSSFSAPV